jgi:hypothetical protein
MIPNATQPTTSKRTRLQQMKKEIKIEMSRATTKLQAARGIACQGL